MYYYPLGNSNKSDSREDGFKFGAKQLVQSLCRNLHIGSRLGDFATLTLLFALRCVSLIWIQKNRSWQT